MEDVSAFPAKPRLCLLLDQFRRLRIRGNPGRSPIRWSRFLFLVVWDDRGRR